MTESLRVSVINIDRKRSDKPLTQRLIHFNNRYANGPLKIKGPFFRRNNKATTVLTRISLYFRKLLSLNDIA